VSIDASIDDSWRQEIVARSKRYPPPTVGIDDFSTDNCVCVKINREWVPFLTGVLDILTSPNLWEHETWDYAPQEIIKLIESLAGAETSMTCVNPVTNITFEGGTIVIHYADETTSVVDGSETIVTGVQALGGGAIEVEQGGTFGQVTTACESCDPYQDKPTLDKSGLARSCAIANGLTEWWFDKLQDSLDQAEAAADTVAAIDSILGIFPPVYIVVDQIDDTWNEWVEAGIQIVRALDTVEEREAFHDALYCHLVANNNEFTEAIWQDFRDNYISTMPPLLVFYDWFNNGAIVDRAHRESYGDGAGCESINCGEGCFNVLMDFTVRGYDCVYPRDGSGCYGADDWATFASGVGWKSVVLTAGGAGCGQFNRIQLVVDLGEQRDVTNIRYIWSITTGTPSQEQVFRSNDLSGFTSVYEGNEAAGEKDVAVSINTRYLLFVIEQSAADSPASLPAGEWQIEEIEVTTV